MAQTQTQITDTVSNPDGTPFNGTLSITWTGSSYGSVGGAAPYSTSTKIYNGVLSIRLAPSTSAVPPGFYLAVYTSNDGRSSWVETWQVGPSTVALTLGQVRTTSPGTTTGGGAATIAIGQVTGLSSYLNAISNSLNTVTSTVGGFNSTIGGLTNTVSNLQSTVSSLATSSTSNAAATFIDGEVPGGTVDGSNAVFTLANIPSPVLSLLLTRNGILLSSQDYSLSGSTVSFFSAARPQTGDVLLASYRLGTTGQSSFVDAAVPTGSIDGYNLNFSLTSAPSGSSLKLFKNGFMLIANVDYTLNGSTITESTTPALNWSISRGLESKPTTFTFPPLFFTA